MIKFSKLIFAFSFLFILASCEKDEPAAKSGDLEGTWTAESVIATIESTTSIAGQTFETMVDAEGSAFNYDLTLDGAAFTTSGSYSMTTEGTTVGTPIPRNTLEYTNVSGDGTYTVSGEVMTIEGSFFEFDASGMMNTISSDGQMANFEINSAGKLVFSQDETMTETDAATGAVTISKIISTSVWARK